MGCREPPLILRSASLKVWPSVVMPVYPGVPVEAAFVMVMVTGPLVIAL